MRTEFLTYLESIREQAESRMFLAWCAYVDGEDDELEFFLEDDNARECEEVLRLRHGSKAK